jgi:hypothetical protein
VAERITSQSGEDAESTLREIQSSGNAVDEREAKSDKSIQTAVSQATQANLNELNHKARLKGHRRNPLKASCDVFKLSPKTHLHV